jgi:hypothetical protein
MKAKILFTNGLSYDEDVTELFEGEIVEVLYLDLNNEFVMVLSESGYEHGIDLDRISLINF